MTDKDRTVVLPLNGSSGPAETRLDRAADEPSRAHQEFTFDEDSPPDFAAGLVSFGFIKAAVRRGLRIWLAAAAAGLILGVAVSVLSPAPYQASTSLLLTPGPFENINTAANNDQAMAQSRAVAGRAERRIGLGEDVGSFLASYTVTGLTERVLDITVSAPSASQAVVRARAVAAAFLQFRAAEMQEQQNLMLKSVNQQISRTKQAIQSTDDQISRLSSQQGSSTQQLNSLHNRRTQQEGTLTNLQQAVLGNQTSVEPAVAAAVHGSAVLDAASPLHHSRLKPLVLYAAVGFVVGLFLGLGVVILRALLSDRLRRRDDVAQAIGAPVKLSVGASRADRRLIKGGYDTAADSTAVRRVAGFLDRTAAGFAGAASLAVVPVGDPQVATVSLVSLAVSRARQGDNVMVADLCPGAPAAELLGVTDAGVHRVDVDGGRLILAVPDDGDVVPAGPLYRIPGRSEHSPFTRAVTTASDRVNLTLTLIPLDPSLGSDHLPTWAANAIAVITAGQSSWTKINAVGEMIRIPGTRLLSAVLVGADQTDESLGVTYATETA